MALVLGLFAATHTLVDVSSASAQSVFYGFEGDGWIQAFDELVTFGSARVEMNQGTAFSGANNMWMRTARARNDSELPWEAYHGFRKALPPVQQGMQSCTLTYMLQYKMEDEYSSGLQVADAVTGEIFYRTGGDMPAGMESSGWSPGRATIEGFPAGRRSILTLYVVGKGGEGEGWMRVDDLRFECH